jgi:hypothetical protein
MATKDAEKEITLAQLLSTVTNHTLPPDTTRVNIQNPIGGTMVAPGSTVQLTSRRAAEESSNDVGALPLLSYLLDDMWRSKDPKWDGVLRRLAPAIELGRVLVDRADAFMATHPDVEDSLRRNLHIEPRHRA